MRISRFFCTAAMAAGITAGVGLLSEGARANTLSVNITPASGPNPEVLLYSIDASLSDGGTLTGTFTVDNYYPGNAGLTAWDLAITGGSLPPITFTKSDGFANGIPSGPFPDVKGWDFYNGSYEYGLQLEFSGDLLTGNNVVLLAGDPGPSFELYGGFITGSYLVGNSGTAAYVTPLPSTWMMLITGFVGLGFFAYRGSKKGSVAPAAV